MYNVRQIIGFLIFFFPWVYTYADNLVYMSDTHYGTSVTKNFNEKVLSDPSAGFQTEAKALMIIIDKPYKDSLNIIRDRIEKKQGIAKISEYQNVGQAWWEDEEVLVWENGKPVTYVDINNEDIEIIKRASLKNYKSTIITTGSYNKVDDDNYSTMKIVLIDSSDIHKDFVATAVILTRSDFVKDYGIGHDFKIRSLPNINSLVTNTEINMIRDTFVSQNINLKMYPMFYLTIENESEHLLDAYKWLQKSHKSRNK